MAATRVTVTDKDKGFKKLAASLGEMGSITLGVQGKKAEARHPNPRGYSKGSKDSKEIEISVGELAALHELGLGGQRKRSWCVAWMDENQSRMVQEASHQLAQVLKGTLSRNQALIKLGYEWTESMRKRMDDGKVQPPISKETADRKGHDIPLIDTNTLRNSITYKVWLPQLKSIRDKAQRSAARAAGKRV